MNEGTADADATLVSSIVDRIKPILAGNTPEVQSAVLADLTAMWLVGHQGEGKHALRRELLRAFVALIHRLLPVNEAILFGNGRRDKRIKRRRPR